MFNKARALLRTLLTLPRKIAEKANPDRARINPDILLRRKQPNLSGIQIAHVRTQKSRRFLRGARSKYMPDGLPCALTKATRRLAAAPATAA